MVSKTGEKATRVKVGIDGVDIEETAKVSVTLAKYRVTNFPGDL